jgi:hypothetical protein
VLRAFAVFLIAASQPGEPVRLQKALIDHVANVARFDEMLERARAHIDTMPLGEPRNRLRRSILIATDLRPLVGFDAVYWDEESLPDYYDRLARAYPEFGPFIAQYRLVGQSGRVLYPSQETRAFLLERLKKVPPAIRRGGALNSLPPRP